MVRLLHGRGAAWSAPLEDRHEKSRREDLGAVKVFESEQVPIRADEEIRRSFVAGRQEDIVGVVHRVEPRGLVRSGDPEGHLADRSDQVLDEPPRHALVEEGENISRSGMTVAFLKEPGARSCYPLLSLARRQVLPRSRRKGRRGSKNCFLRNSAGAPPVADPGLGARFGRIVGAVEWSQA